MKYKKYVPNRVEHIEFLVISYIIPRYININKKTLNTCILNIKITKNETIQHSNVRTYHALGI